MGVDLPLVWAVIILFGVMMYVVMDGFDLGVGILFPLVAGKEDRDVMMNSVAPVWDGNETWLVLGGAGLLAAFPVAYAVILSAFYLPLTLMLVGLIFRGVAFEFRFKASAARRHWWDKAFAAGSMVAAFFQGVTIGAFVAGVPVSDGAYAGGPFLWLQPFPLFTGVGLVVAYALLGDTWLVMKTAGGLQARMRTLGVPLTLALFAVIVVISIWTPLVDAEIARRWFSAPTAFWFLPVPVLLVLATIGLLRGLDKGEASPFVFALALIFLGYTGLGISLWPHIVPPALTIWQAAGPPQSLGFALVGTLLILPFTLVYTAWAYWVFRGKVRPDAGYH